MQTRRYAPDRSSLFPALLFGLGALPIAASDPALVWVLLLPVAPLVWVLRARVLADSDGVEVCNGLGRRRYAWDQVTGFDVPRRGVVRMLLLGGSRVPLSTVSRRQLRSLIELGGPAG